MQPLLQVCQGKVLFSLHGETEAPVSVAPVLLKENDSESFNSFLDSFNQLVLAGKKSAILNKSSERLLSSLSHVVASNYSELMNNGIASSTDGYLLMNKGIERNALNSGFSGKLFSENSSFCRGLENRLSSTILNPMKYVDKNW